MILGLQLVGGLVVGARLCLQDCVEDVEALISGSFSCRTGK